MWTQSEEMQNQAVEVAQDAMDKFSIEKDIAQYIKKEVHQATTCVTQVKVSDANVTLSV